MIIQCSPKLYFKFFKDRHPFDVCEKSQLLINYDTYYLRESSTMAIWAKTTVTCSPTLNFTHMSFSDRYAFILNQKFFLIKFDVNTLC